MFEFLDRVQSNPTRIKLTAVEGLENTYDYEKVGTVAEQGTPINRAALMAIQGFQAQNTVFNPDGSITETNGLNQTKTTTFNSDGSVTEKFVGDKTITKKTKFNSDGSITEELV